MERFVVVYDVANDRRRNQVFKALKDYGIAVQESVFEIELREEDLLLLQDRLRHSIRVAEDTVVFYRLCHRCVESIQRIGVGEDPFASPLTII